MNKKFFKIFIKNLIIFCIENYNKNMNKKLTVLDEQEVYDKARQAIKELKEAI